MVADKPAGHCFKWFFVMTLLVAILSCSGGQNSGNSTPQVKEPLRGDIHIVRAVTNSKIYPDTVIGVDNASKGLSVTACPMEYESVSFVISAKTGIQNLLSVSSDLVKGGDRISSSNVDIKIVKSWYQGGISGKLDYTLLWGGPQRNLMPELLLHDSALVIVDSANKTNYLRIREGNEERYIDISRENGDPSKYDPLAGQETDLTMPGNVTFDDSATLQPVNIPAGENQQFWVTVYVPPDTPPGLYDGSITIHAANTIPEAIPFQVNVLPFTLDKPMLEYGLYYLGYMSATKPDRVGYDAKSETQLRAEIYDMARHGVVSCTVTQNYVPSLTPEFGKFLEIMRSAAMGDKLYMLWGGNYFISQEKTASLLAYAKGYGFNDVYFYGGDELQAAQLPGLSGSWGQMQGWGGKIFASMENAAYSAPDILDLAVVDRIRDPLLAAAFHDRGHRIFSYGVPQVGLEEPETYRRSYGLALWKTGYDGAMLYAYQRSWGSIWNDFDGYFRDHVFAYPTTNGVVDTIQWEGFREAVDDVRYMTTLVNLVAKAKSQGVPTTDVEQWIAGIDTAGDLDLIRNGIIERILRLRTLVR